MFQFSKILSGLLDPAMMLALLLGLVGHWAKSDDYRVQRFGFKGLTFLFLVMIFAAVLPVGDWAMRPLEDFYANEKIPEKADGIILLTGDENPRISEERGLAVVSSAASRYIHTSRLARKYPDARIVVSGTTAPIYHPQQMTTQQVSKDILDAVGVKADRVRYETESRNTHENAVNTFNLVKPKTGEKWILVTSGYHMPRAVLTFQKAGFEVVPSVSDYTSAKDPDLFSYPSLGLTFCTLRTAAHEYFGLMSYWYFGWIDWPWA